MSAATIIVTLVVLHVVLSLLAARSPATEANAAPPQPDAEDDWSPEATGHDPFDDESGKTGNLPSEEYGGYAGAKSALDDY